MGVGLDEAGDIGGSAETGSDVTTVTSLPVPVTSPRTQEVTSRSDVTGAERPEEDASSHWGCRR